MIKGVGWCHWHICSRSFNILLWFLVAKGYCLKVICVNLLIFVFKVSLYSFNVRTACSGMWDPHCNAPVFPSESLFLESFSDCWLGWYQKSLFYLSCFKQVVLKNLASASGLWMAFYKPFLVLSQASFWFLWSMSARTYLKGPHDCFWRSHSWLYRSNYFASSA